MNVYRNRPCVGAVPTDPPRTLHRGIQGVRILALLPPDGSGGLMAASITNITTERLNLTIGAGIRIVATTTDGRTISIPVVWSDKDFDAPPRPISTLVQSLFENAIGSVIDILEDQP